MNDLKTVLTQIAPSGELRVALNYGNPVLVQRGADGIPQGVAPDLARELARRLGVVPRFISYEAAAKVAEVATDHAWDLAFMAIDPKREAHIDFTAAYVQIEGTYLVRDSSPWHKVAELDREGVRIAVAKGAAYELYLARTIQQAELVAFSTSNAAIHGFVSQHLEAAAGVRQTLMQFAAENADYRVLEDHYTAIYQALALPKGRRQALDYVRAFVEEMKHSGFVAEALRRSGQHGANVAL